MNSIKEMFDKENKDLFISINTTCGAVDTLLDNLYEMGATFPNKEKMNAWEVFAMFNRFSHGNSKPILHIFHNEITNRDEMQVTYKAVIKSYPQYKKAITVYNADGSKPGKSYKSLKEEARNKAIEWQYDLDSHDYSWGELAAWNDYFSALAKRYGLIREFRENCII